MNQRAWNMRGQLILAVLLAVLMGAFASSRLIAQAQGDDACKIVQEAVGARYAIRPGMTRSEVKRTFETSGGLSFRSKTLYSFRKCRYLMVEVEFDPSPTSEREFSADDKVKSVSRLYADYPPRD